MSGDFRRPGGLPAMRPEQVPQPAPPRIISPGSSNIFRGQLVVIFGTGPDTGLFVYNGAPALGNPPIFALTLASQDPYGNVVTPSAITDSGLPFLIYSGAPALGNLILSMAPAAGTDAFGNSFPQGLNVTTGIISALSVSASTETLNPGPLLLYGNTTTVVQYLTGSGNWPVPATVTAPDGTPNAVQVEGWGASAGGGGGLPGTPQIPAYGSGGGEYAAEPHLAVTPSGTMPYSVGAGGSAGSFGVIPGAGGNTTATGTSVTLTAHGSPADGTAGRGSTNTIHHSGGLGGSYTSGVNGPGGGSSGGPSSAGNNGHNSGGGGAGASAVPGGGAGGNGSPTANGTGSSGTVPGGGAGGSGTGTSGSAGAGRAGQLRVTYVTSGAASLVAALASAAGTDPNTGTAYPGPGLGLAGLATAPAALAGFVTLYGSGVSGFNQLKYSSDDGNLYNTGRITLQTTSTQAISATTPGVVVTSLSLTSISAGTYRVRGVIAYTENAAAGTPNFYFTAPTAANVLITVFTVTRGSASSPLQTAAVTGFGSGNAWAGPTMASVQKVMRIEGIFAATGSAGGFALNAFTSAGADTFTIQPQSFIDLLPVA